MLLRGCHCYTDGPTLLMGKGVRFLEGGVSSEATEARWSV
jgi:hypothetical protein